MEKPMSDLSPEEQCDCPRPSAYLVKHTAGCYERRISELTRLLRIANGAAIEMASLNESQARLIADFKTKRMHTIAQLEAKVAEMESLVAIYKGRDDGKQLVINQLEQPQPETATSRDDADAMVANLIGAVRYDDLGSNKYTRDEILSAKRTIVDALCKPSPPPQPETRSVRRTPGHDAYVKHCDSSGIHSNRFPAWSELTAKERDEWEPRDTTTRALLDRAIDTISEFHEACEPSEDHESAIAPGNAFRILVDELAKLCYDRRQMDKQLGICPHGMPVNENVCGPCSQGRPNRPPPPPKAPPSSDLRDYGYAPGNYWSHCLTCDNDMTDVDKRCRCCKPCAEKKRDAALKAIEPTTPPTNYREQSAEAILRAWLKQYGSTDGLSISTRAWLKETPLDAYGKALEPEGSRGMHPNCTPPCPMCDDVCENCGVELVSNTCDKCGHETEGGQS